MAIAIISDEEFASIVSEYQAKLNGFACRMTGSREDAEDAVQDAFFRAYRSLCAMSQEQRRALPLRPWLYAITRNAALNVIRKKRRSAAISLDGFDEMERELLGVVDRETPEEALLQNASRQEVEQTIRRLPAHLSEAALLRFVDGYTTSQIAISFGQPLGTVKSHLHRAVNAMRRILNEAA